ncbi:MAG: hypothetical protein HYU53_14455 [Acidobacteria bacterium]|nr:hypothetical protein [Acidobacteriota bacterium]
MRVFRGKRHIKATAILVAPLLALLAARAPDDLHARATAALSQIDGTIELAGLREPVEVIRDTWGVPDIWVCRRRFVREGVAVDGLRPERLGEAPFRGAPPHVPR